MRSKKSKTEGEIGENDQSQTDWTRLPTELWINIFRWLPIKSRLNFSSTCKILHHLCQDPCIWTRVSIDWQSIKKAQATEKFLSRCTKLSHLILTNSEQVSNPLTIDVEEENGVITNLTLSPKVALAYPVIMKLPDLSKLRSLELDGFFIKTRVTSALGTLTLLECLKIPGSEQITSNDLKVEGLRGFFLKLEFY